MASILPEYEELDEDLVEEDEEVEAEEETSTTWILNEATKTIGALSDDRDECVIQSAKCMLQTEQQEYEIYPINYGSRLHEMIGDTKPHVYAEIEYAVKECLAFDERIEGASDFKFEDDGGDVAVRFNMQISDSEDVEMEEEVSV